MYKTFIIVAFLGLLSNTFIFSQEERNSECRELLKEISATPDEIIDILNDPCSALAIELQTKFDSARLAMTDSEVEKSSLAPGFLTPRSLQTVKANTASTVSALNQSEAVPALYPFALAGGSIGGTGSEGGTNALTAISINPAIFFANMDDTDESAKWGRTMDLTAIVPLTGINALDSQKLQYFGLRGRINFTGAKEGSELYEEVLTKFREVLVSAEKETDKIQELILSARNSRECVEQFMRVINEGADASSVTSPCGGEFSVSEEDEIFSSFKSELDKLVAEADKKYLGLDLRGDFGDPTLGAVDSAAGTSIFVGLGYGFSTKGYNQQKGGTTLNSRLGIRYKDMEDVEATLFDVDGAIGLELSWPYQFQQIKFGLGLDFRVSMDEKLETPIETDLTEAFETDYLYYRMSLNVPITPSNGISVQYGTSIVGQKAPVLSVNFSWNLLLEN